MQLMEINYFFQLIGFPKCKVHPQNSDQVLTDCILNILLLTLKSQYLKSAGTHFKDLRSETCFFPLRIVPAPLDGHLHMPTVSKTSQNYPCLHEQRFNLHFHITQAAYRGNSTFSEFLNAQPTNTRSPTHLGHGSGTPSQHSIHSQSTQHKQHPSCFFYQSIIALRPLTHCLLSCTTISL